MRANDRCRKFSRMSALPGLRLHLGKSGCGLLDIGWKIRKLLHLADLDDFVIRSGTARGTIPTLLRRNSLSRWYTLIERRCLAESRRRFAVAGPYLGEKTVWRSVEKHDFERKIWSAVPSIKKRCIEQRWMACNICVTSDRNCRQGQDAVKFSCGIVCVGLIRG